MTEETSPRENLIETAVKFLQNPKVRNSSFAQRKEFLKKKGLTDTEIQLAVEKSGTAGDEALETQQQLSQPHLAQQAVIPVQVSPPTESKWHKFRDYTATAVIITGFSSAIYIIYKKYVVPYLVGSRKRDSELQQLTQSINQLQQTMQDVRTSLTEQQETLQSIVTNINRSSHTTSEVLGLQEVKEELKSVKGLLLNRRQFPTVPTNTPVIPSWQLTSPFTKQSEVENSATSTTSPIQSTPQTAESDDSAAITETTPLVQATPYSANDMDDAPIQNLVSFDNSSGDMNSNFDANEFEGNLSKSENQDTPENTSGTSKVTFKEGQAIHEASNGDLALKQNGIDRQAESTAS